MKKSKRYSSSTGTSVLRRHLLKSHLDAWVKACDDQKLSIGGEEARGIVADYHQQRSGFPEAVLPAGVRPRFTKENLVQAIITFVVSDDQVCLVSSFNFGDQCYWLMFGFRH